VLATPWRLTGMAAAETRVTDARKGARKCIVAMGFGIDLDVRLR
jgi:hypothetical protein